MGKKGQERVVGVIYFSRSFKSIVHMWDQTGYNTMGQQRIIDGGRKRDKLYFIYSFDGL